MTRTSMHLVAFFLTVLASAASAQSFNSALPGSFVDISLTGGTAFIGAGDDTMHTFTSTIGNSLFPAGAIAVSSNGVALSGASAGAYVTFGNGGPITSATTPASVGLPACTAAVCAFWDDLYTPIANPNTTIWWQELSGVLYIMWKDIDHFYPSPTYGLITFEIQVFSNPGCGSPAIQILYPDATFEVSGTGVTGGASATIGYINGAPGNGLVSAGWSYNTPSVSDGTTLSIGGTAFTHTWTSPLGSGSLQANIAGGPSGGLYFLAITFNAGSFPNGWFYGLSIGINDLAAEINAGFPFVGPLDGCGGFQLGPFGGLPPGLTLYSVVVAAPAGSTVPIGATPAVTYTIP